MRQETPARSPLARACAEAERLGTTVARLGTRKFCAKCDAYHHRKRMKSGRRRKRTSSGQVSERRSTARSPHAATGVACHVDAGQGLRIETAAALP